MKLLGAVISRSGARCRHYADDIQFHLFVISEAGEGVHVLNWCLDAVINWMRANELWLDLENPERAETLWIGSSNVWKLGCVPAQKEQVSTLRCFRSIAVTINQNDLSSSKCPLPISVQLKMPISVQREPLPCTDHLQYAVCGAAFAPISEAADSAKIQLPGGWVYVWD